MNDKYDTIKKEIVINASVDKVYSALISPEQLTNGFLTLQQYTQRLEEKYFLDL
jgi:uncharacterized protein YndB with AHSA1/START domain